MALLFYRFLPPIGQKKRLNKFQNQKIFFYFSMYKRGIVLERAKNKHHTPIVSEGFLFKTVNKKDKRNVFKKYSYKSR